MKLSRIHPKFGQIKKDYFNPTQEDLDEGVWSLSFFPGINIFILVMNLFSNEYRHVKGIIYLGNIVCYSLLTLLIWKPI